MVTGKCAYYLFETEWENFWESRKKGKGETEKGEVVKEEMINGKKDSLNANRFKVRSGFRIIPVILKKIKESLSL